MKRIVVVLAIALLPSYLAAQINIDQDLGGNPVPQPHDVEVRVIPISNQYSPGATVVPQAVVCNIGANRETFDVTCNIEKEGCSAYSMTSPAVTLEPFTEEVVQFPSFIASEINELYEITVTAVLEGDSDDSNNFITGFFDTYTVPRDMVILEIGTGTWCQYCPGSAMGADDLIANGHNVAVVEYHYGDSFANGYASNRITYYNITGFPTAVFDGILRYVGGSTNQSLYPVYLPLFQQRAAINSAFEMGIFGENVGNLYNLTIVIDKTGEIQWNNMVLHVVLTESNIPFNWFNQTHVNFAERTMIPNSSGTPINFDSGDHLEVDLNFTFNNAWEAANCELVAFIQNLPNKEILQGTKLMLGDLTPLPGGCDYVIGDFNGSGTFNVSDVIDAFSKLKTGLPAPAFPCECPPGSGNSWAVAMDVNNSCAFNVSDVIDAFSKLKTGSPQLVPCDQCPPGGRLAPGGNQPTAVPILNALENSSNVSKTK